MEALNRHRNITMLSLPPMTQPYIVNYEPNVLSAYNAILDFERNAKTSRDALHARILGYLILHAPSIDARDEMVSAIDLCSQTHDTLSGLGQYFLDHFIRPFKKFKEHTPVSSEDSTPPSFYEEKMDLLTNIQETPKDHKTAKSQALIRDGYKCVLTGKYDSQALDIPDIDDETICRVGAVNTRCAHIAPESTYFNDFEHPNSPEKTLYSASFMAVLKRFGYDAEKLDSEKVHLLFNVMTMQYDVYFWFYRLELWFEATEVKDCYRVRALQPAWRVPEKMTFTSSDPTNLPVPSPEFLALHATCAKVAQFSGAGAYLDELDQDVEDLGVLAGDGRSVDVLTHALTTSMSMSWEI